MPKLNMVQAINLGLRQEMEKDDSVVVLGEDVGVDGGVFRVTDGLIEEFGESRVIDTPLANNAEPIEILRVLHSFDFCCACTVHVMSAKGEKVAEAVLEETV